MNPTGCARLRGAALAFLVAAGMVLDARAQDPQVLERARSLIAAGKAAQAFEQLAPLQASAAGNPEFDYLLGVAALDSGRIEDAVVAFERVIAVMPNHAGAQMDLARAYYAAGSFDLAEAAFRRLEAANPPAAAREAIARYLDAIQQRRRQTQAGWGLWAELGLGYDSNLTGVPTDFGAAALQSFNIVDLQPTGNSVKRSAAFGQAVAGAEYHQPLSRGWSLFGGAEARGRWYRHESDFDAYSGELRGGAALNQGTRQWRFAASYLDFDQQGAAPGDPQPTNDRRMSSLSADWRLALDTKTQLGLGVQLNAVRFPTNAIEDFDQLYLSASWLRSFERPGVPTVLVTAFATEDRAKNDFPGADPGTTTSKSKNLAGVRGFLQYTVAPNVDTVAGLGWIHRRDQDPFARSTTVEKGRDNYLEAILAAAWQWRKECALRLQYVYSRNRSNIDIYDFDRHEITTTIRCATN